MSRKWSRMVSKNRKTVNIQRKKQGTESISQGSSETTLRFAGRSWILPLVFIGIGLYMLSINAYYEGDSSYKFIIFAYPALGVFMYFVRRPILRIGSTAISSRRFAGDKKVEAADIDRIELLPGAIFIRFKSKRQGWMFSRFTHIFPIKEASAKLEEFALQHQIPIQRG